MGDLLKGLGVVWIVLWVFAIVMGGFTSYDTTDDIENETRSGLSLYVDHATGCHYIKGGVFGTIVPRVGRDGRQICEEY